MVRAAMLAMALASCATAPSGGLPLTGRWGGQHVGLELSAAGGRTDYDCAAGTIDEPLVPDGAGRFSARGMHTPGQGGPDRMDYVPPSFPALYSGQVRGDSLSLRIEVPAMKVVIGPYQLRRGAEPILMRCL